MSPTSRLPARGNVSAETNAWIPRIPKAVILSLCLLILVWLWAAFVRGEERLPTFTKWVLVAGAVGILIAVSWALLYFLGRNVTSAPELRGTVLGFGFCGFLLLGVFLPEYLLGSPPSLFKSASLFGFALLLYIGLVLAAHRLAIAPTASSYFPMAPGKLLFLGCSVYFFLTSWLAIAKLRAFGYVGQDIAYFTQCLYTTLHGHLFYSNMYHDLLYGKPVTSDFAGHNQLVLFVFLPFYSLYKSAATLLIVRNFFVVLCSWPVYLISRRIVSPLVSNITAFAFLLIPAVLYQNLYDFAPLSLAGFPLLFAFYFYLEGNFKFFVIALLLAQIVREDLVIAVFGLGLLALWQRRDLRWVAFPCSLAIGWALLSWKIIFPHFLQGASSVVASCFAYLGHTPGQMIHSMFRHPDVVLSHSNLVYIKQLINSFGGFLFLFSPACLISTPYILINLLGQGGGCNTAMIYRHYSLIPTVLLFASFLLSLGMLGSLMQQRGKSPDVIQTALIMFVFAAAASSTLFVTGRPQFEDLRSSPWHAEAKQVANFLPEDASVAVPRYMLPSVANRSGLYLSLRLLEYHHPDAQYIVLDKDWDRAAATDQWKQNYYKLWSLLDHDSRYSVVYNTSNYIIFKLCDGCATDLPHLEPILDMHE